MPIHALHATGAFSQYELALCCTVSESTICRLLKASPDTFHPTQQQLANLSKLARLRIRDLILATRALEATQPYSELALSPMLIRSTTSARTVVYFLALDASRVKIGFTGQLKRRLAAHQTSAGKELHLLATIPGTRATERELHKKFASLRVGDNKEIFHLDGPITQWLEWLRNSEFNLSGISPDAMTELLKPVKPGRARSLEELNTMFEKGTFGPAHKHA